MFPVAACRPKSGAGLFGAVVSPFPSGADALWYGDTYQTTGTNPLVPNSATATPVSTNLIRASSRMFSLDMWSQSNITVTDANATDHSGNANYASTVSNPGGQWRLFQNLVASDTAGNYTVGIWARLKSGTADVYLGDANTTSAGPITLTSSWVRISKTVSVGAATNMFIYFGNMTGSPAACDVEISDFTCYPGSSDLGGEAFAGHLMLGYRNVSASTLPSYSGGLLNFGSNNAVGIAQFATGVDLSAFTLIACCKRTATGGGGDTFQPILSRALSWPDFSAGNSISNQAGLRLASTNVFALANGYLPYFIDDVNRGYAVFGCSWDGSTGTFYINGIKMFSIAQTITAPVILDFFFNQLLGNGFNAGNTYSSVCKWPRALLDGEVATATTSLVSRLTSAGQSISPNRWFFGEGDSIAAGQGGAPGFMFLTAKNASPSIRGWNLAVPGSGYAEMTARIQRLLDIKSALPVGQKMIVATQCWTNNAIDTTAFNAHISYHATLRNAGILTIETTILPTSDASREVARATFNPQIVLGVGTNWDAVADIASNSTMGNQANTANATYYTDGVHPADAGYALIEPYLTTALNSL